MNSKTLRANGSLPFVILFMLITIISKATPSVIPTHITQSSGSLFSSDTISDPEPFQKVEIEASFPGGQERWLQFLTQNVNGDVPVRRNAPEGNYTVVVQFIVDKEGRISDIKPLTNFGYGMEDEVVRILRMSPTWKPAMYKGRAVKGYRKQPVTFVVKLERKGKGA